MNPWPDDDVILYDGVCVFCSRWVRFVATRDVEQRFRFTAIQSGYGTRLAKAFGIDPGDPDTNALGACLAPRAKTAPRRRLQSRRPESLSDFREV